MPVTVSQSRETNHQFVKLQAAFGDAFVIWEGKEDAWLSPFENPDCIIPDALLLERAWQSRRSVAHEVEVGRYWLAVPLRDARSSEVKRVAAALIENSSPQLLCGLADASVENQRQDEHINQLREENSVFLQQVSEDFEELAFLRSMAERLALRDSSPELDHLMQHTLPRLGAAAGVKSLYYLTALEGGSLPLRVEVAEQWHRNPEGGDAINPRTLGCIVREFREDASCMPVVRNNLQVGERAPELPGVREIILVELSTTDGHYGWLLAVNRANANRGQSHQAICKLSQNELGTNEASLINTAAAILASHAHNLTMLEERKSLMVNMVRTLVSAIDSRDPYTCGHSERVARYGKRLAEAVGFDEIASERFYLTGLLHDIGKIGISDAVLNKKDALSEKEYDEIKRHPDLGWAILRELEQFEYVLPGVLHHHERFDGKGYPDGLTGAETPLDGRLLAVVDAFDAMTSDRPYRQGMPVEKAIGILTEGAGGQWDAALIETFMSILPDIVEIKDNYQRPLEPCRVPGELRDANGVLIHGEVAAND